MPVHRLSGERQRFAATYVLPDQLAPRIRRELAAPDVGPALRGLRQWLRLRILTDKPMGMPSLAVRTALTEFLAITGAADTFRRNAIGRHGQDHLADGILPNEAAGPTMALTWAMACNDEHIRMNGAGSLPTLFFVDEAMAVAGGWPWTMYCGHEPCATPDNCVHHDLLPYLPERIPDQLVFDRPRAHSLADKSDALWAPGYYGSFGSAADISGR